MRTSEAAREIKSQKVEWWFEQMNQACDISRTLPGLLIPSRHTQSDTLLAVLEDEAFSTRPCRAQNRGHVPTQFLPNAPDDIVPSRSRYKKIVTSFRYSPSFLLEV